MGKEIGKGRAKPVSYLVAWLLLSAEIFFSFCFPIFLNFFGPASSTPSVLSAGGQKGGGVEFIQQGT